MRKKKSEELLEGPLGWPWVHTPPRGTIVYKIDRILWSNSFSVIHPQALLLHEQTPNTWLTWTTIFTVNKKTGSIAKSSLFLNKRIFYRPVLLSLGTGKWAAVILVKGWHTNTNAKIHQYVSTLDLVVVITVSARRHVQTRRGHELIHYMCVFIQDKLPTPQWVINLMFDIEEATEHELTVEYK